MILSFLFSVILTQLNLYATVNSVGFLHGLLVRNSKITSMLCVYIQHISREGAFLTLRLQTLSVVRNITGSAVQVNLTS